METSMGEVLVTAKIENLFDIEERERGVLSASQVRSVEVIDALVDTRAWGLLLPKRLIALLGVRQFCTRQERGISGETPIPTYSVVRLTIQGRDCSLDVGEISDDLPILIGQIPLQMLDFVVDGKNQRLIGNPEHGGEDMMDVF